MVKQPRIIFAWGYGSDLHLFRALNNRPLKPTARAWNGDTLGWVFSRMFTVAPKSVKDNYYRGDLYVDGFCGGCRKPYAPKDAFVLALIPNGLAYATREPHPKYSHMGPFKYVAYPRAKAFALAGGFGLLAVVVYLRVPARQRRRRRLGLCETCSYDLKGNESGVCPECGQRIRDGCVNLPRDDDDVIWG